MNKLFQMTGIANAPTEVTVEPGYSPKPANLFAPIAGTSPSPSGSPDPDTSEPDGALTGPDLTARVPFVPDNGEFTVRNGIVSFS